MTLQRTPTVESTWISFALGALLMTHFVIVCAIKSAQGIPGDVLWMSHVALAFAGGGLLLGSRLFTGAALTAVAIPHMLWLIDFVTAQFVGSHPLRITHYLHGADTLTWIATAHHFYLLPLLSVIVLCGTRYRFASLNMAALLTIGFTLLSRAVLPPSLNVNFAFTTLPGLDIAPLRWLHSLPAAGYLAVQIAGQIVVLILPAALLLRFLTRHAPTLEDAVVSGHARRHSSVPAPAGSH
jgi:hypothetical protein